MLTCLQIRDFAIIDGLRVELGAGLNVLTGETGAGKSILISALELVLGAKGRPEYVRKGAERAEVEALFEVRGDAALLQRLSEFDVTDDEMVVRRVVLPNGRTRAFVNGRLATRTQLAELTRGLVDISSQHLHHTLTDASTHLGFLDAFAGLSNERKQVRAAYLALEKARGVLEDFEARLRDRSLRQSLAEAAVREIEAIAPRPGEDTRLEAKSTRLRNSEALLQLVGEAAQLLYEGNTSATDLLAQAGQRLHEASAFDPSLTELAERLEANRSSLEDAARDLGRVVRAGTADSGVADDGGYDSDRYPVDRAQTLELVEERLFELCKLKRRYGGTLTAVLEHLERCRNELDELEQHVEVGEQLEHAYSEALAEARSSARALSTKRRRAAPRLATAITSELASLGMGEARVRVEVGPLSRSSTPRRNASPQRGEPRTVHAGATGNNLSSAAGSSPDISAGDGPDERLGPEGMDSAEFMIAPNRGEEALPLHRVASGGELSRAMLAIKCVLAELGPAGMYAFDEVDSGVGGGMAEIIGRKIHAVSRHRQVLCVTHLPQIAVFADRHFKVEKSLQGERTLSTIRELGTREQREEIARMLGGLKITQKTRAAARELLHQARTSAA